MDIKRGTPALLVAAIVVVLLVSSSVQGVLYLVNETPAEDHIISNLCGQIEVPADSDYYIKFNSQNKKFEQEESVPVATGLSERELHAVAKAPTWVQRKLIQQFQNLNNTEEYVDLLLESDLRFTDEIAFTLAYSPLGIVPPVDVIKENVHVLYTSDSFIHYADIIDYDEGNGNYYSTVRYRVLENGTTKEYEYPRDIYYRYVVYPRINREECMLVYDRTWRNYLFYHNDVGHPLLKENVDNVIHLWDGKSDAHNTGIEAMQRWIGNTIRYEVIGDRQDQPSLIAHEHTGYCGETQKLAVATFRSALIPVNGIMNYAEDHVWEEFYERGWYHYDGAVNTPYMYTDGWGKNMSSIWAWNGDSSIYEVTSTYIHPEDRVTVEFTVTDGYNNPIDGVVVTVFVKGLKDISWHKDYILDIIDSIWEKIPDILKTRILERIYALIHQKINDIEDVIDTYLVSIWNYTDITGHCSFELGKDDEYIFIIQKPDLQSIWPLYRFTRIRVLTETRDIKYNIRFNDFSNPVKNLKERNEIDGDYTGNIKLDLSSYQLQRNILTTEIGTYTFDGVLDFFIVDEQNFERYQMGKTFEYYYYQETHDAEIDFQLNEQDYYIIFRNHAHMTNVILDYDVSINSSDDNGNITIVTPTPVLFEKPAFTIGTTIVISGISPNNQLTLTIGDQLVETITPHQNSWCYHWDTRDSEPGIYLLSAESNQSKDAIYMELIDTIPPEVDIISPNNMDLFDNGFVTIRGRAKDNYKLEKVELIINENIPILVDGKEEWSYSLDVTHLTPGEYVLEVKAYDYSNLTTHEEITIVRNDPDHQWAPIVNSLFMTPEDPTNASMIRIYSNITSESPFSIKKVLVYYDTGTGPIKQDMFRYGDYPPQERHVEDNIQDISNTPVYGLEIGRFQTTDNVTYWVEAHDTAGNTIISEKKSFIIQ